MSEVQICRRIAQGSQGDSSLAITYMCCCIDISKHTDFQEESLKLQDVVSPQRMVSGGICSLEQKLGSGWSYL